ncbi:cytochrome-c oxidase, cbb3-type subunit III [Sphingosinicella xenopeptidilytica]|uniref:Cbb3-type cytochrome c oxidase subunit n=1 Tax=Sphingosinicella xenopeptidilytica TaxID=364098 RepID=A0ABW3C608_SPHXN
MSDNKRIDEPTGTETVGHEWDGIEELDTPLPRWWLWTFYITIVWALIYTILFPAWPLVERATAGVLGWSSHGELNKELAAADAKLLPIREAIGRTPVENIPNDPELLRAAVAGGQSTFKVYCVQCHGSGAAGGKGYPNLNDDDWLWGGDINAIHYTIEHGIRNPDHDETRLSMMPAFGRDGILTPAQISNVVSYVQLLSGEGKASNATARGAQIYAENCVSCHGAEGKGDRVQGAPDLTDAIWLYGGDRDTLIATVTNSRQGVMPRWGNRLDPATVKMLATYVHSLGGGEATVVAAAEPAPAAGGAENVAP